MQRYALQERQGVFIPGKSFLGFPTTLELDPIQSGWSLMIGNKEIPLSPEMLDGRWRRLALKHPRGTLHIPEHLLALRFAVDGIRIVPSLAGLPYSGDGFIFWKHIRSRIHQAGALVPCTVNAEVEGDSGPGRVVCFTPWDKEYLELKIYIDYAGVGSGCFEWRFPENDIDKLATAKSPGWPLSWRKWARMAKTCGIGPGEKAFHWSDGSEAPNVVLESYARHRALDLLGALAVLAPPGQFLVGKVCSHCAGHKADVMMIREAAKKGLRIVNQIQPARFA